MKKCDEMNVDKFAISENLLETNAKRSYKRGISSERAECKEGARASELRHNSQSDSQQSRKKERRATDLEFSQQSLFTYFPRHDFRVVAVNGHVIGEAMA